jgi:hypothetical protein
MQLHGEDSKVMVGSTVVGYMNSLNINFTNNTVSRKYFQDESTSYIKTGEDCTISISGDWVPSDAGQSLLLVDMFADNATVASGLKIYEDSTHYWSTVSGTILIDSVSISSASDGIITANVGFKVNGTISRT